MRTSAIAILTFALASPAYSFDVDGFKTGMPFAAARALLESRPYSNYDIKEGEHILAWDKNERLRTVSLSFCKGRLVLKQRHLQPRFDHFVRLIDDKRRELGRPHDTWAQPADVTSTVLSNGLKFVWRDGPDFVVVSFTEFSSNSQLDITYETPNDCWRTRY